MDRYRFEAWRDQLEDDELAFAGRLETMPEDMRVSWLAVEFYRLRKAIVNIESPASRKRQVITSTLGTGLGGTFLIAVAIAAKMLGVAP